jgi:hypothetical protein
MARSAETRDLAAQADTPFEPRAEADGTAREAPARTLRIDFGRRNPHSREGARAEAELTPTDPGGRRR